MNRQVKHIPVLAETLVEQVKLPRDGVMVDTTIGQGGHSLLFGRNLGPEGLIVGMDLDKNSIRRAHFNLKELDCRVILICANFSRLPEHLQEQGISQVDFVLADLGVSSPQLADAEMGLSFQANMPLDMRFNKRLKTTAADIVNETDEKSLADLIYRFGQDRASRRIARFIVHERATQPIATTGRLAAIVTSALRKGAKRNRIHPATRTFQALRIAVNNELDNLEKMLASVPEILKPNGRVAVISYHSLEDRIVKNSFKQNEKSGIYRIITKKPIVPSRLLVFIFIIAFIINGLPNLHNNQDNNHLTRTLTSPPTRPLGIGQEELEIINQPILPRKNTTDQADHTSSAQKNRFEMPLPDITGTQETIDLRQKAHAPPKPTIQSKKIVKEKQHRPTWPKIYIVKPGDNLTVIAKKFYGPLEGNKIANIKNIFRTNRNKLKSPDQILEGQKILIPPLLGHQEITAKRVDVFSSAMFETAESIGKTHLSKNSTKTRQSRLYVVRNGDSLWRIAAEQLGDPTRSNEIARLNAKILQDQDMLFVGMRLKIPAR